MARLKDAHFFRRVPADVSEATSTGGLISIVAFVTIVWLVLTQYSESFTMKRTTQLRLDRGGMALGAAGAGSGNIRINFNISMHHLPCQYAALHIADHVGSHKMGTSRNVHKVRLSRTGERIGMFEPHKYHAGEPSDMAGHVFPWHKKQHAQGDAEQAKLAEQRHLSDDQKKVVSKVETAIHTAGKGAHAGRRLLSIEEPDAPAQCGDREGEVGGEGGLPNAALAAAHANERAHVRQ